jgi:hypothetical protein
MILKLKNGCYVDFERGYEFGAQEVGAGGARIWCNYVRGSNVTVMDGYATVEDAQDALDEFMSDQDVSAFADPTANESEEDLDENLVSYADMSVEELRLECGGRTPPLSTTGKKSELVARLIADDNREEGV